MRRSELYQVMLQHHEEAVAEYQRFLDRLKSDSDIDENETQDMEDYSHQSEANDMEIRTKVQMSKAIQDLDAFKALKGIVSNGEVMDGSFVLTKDRIFFIGVPSSSIEHDSYKMIGVSSESPAYESIVGKKIGDKVQLGRLKCKIEEIY